MTDDAQTPNQPARGSGGGTSGAGSDRIEPDTKDWTWVLQRPCPECGFVAADADPGDIPEVVRSLTPRWRAALARPDVRTRPAPGVWSALEYGAHVRDVNRIFTGRLQAMLSTDDPLFSNWDQDAAAVENRYAAQDPAEVADELADAADAFARLLASTVPEQWERPGRRSNGSTFTVRTLAQYYLHDVVHHVHDVRA